jgi:hypothetical protein
MGRHVIRPLVSVPEQRVSIWHEASEEPIEIGPHTGVSVLLNEQARRRVAKEQGQQTVADVGVSDPLKNVGCDLEKAAP